MHHLVPLTQGQHTQTAESTKVAEDMSQNNKAMPGRTRAGETKCLEPGCNFICSRIPQLRTHLEDGHSILQERKMFVFNSEKDFNTWLSAVESEARCTYMRRRGWQANKNGSMTACFYCHRGGAYTSKATKKQMKIQGSCKIGVECTSSMKVSMWTSSNQKDGDTKDMEVTRVQVEAYLQHYGHNLDLNHTRITKREKDDIARKLNSGISRHKILDEIRGTLDTTSAPHRLHLLSLQDLYNIEKKEGIKNKKSSEEGTTVQAWIEKMQKSEDNPVLLIKYQQEKATEACSCLSDDDFILILQTPLQAMMLHRYGPRQCICIDVTRGESVTNGSKNDPNFYLMSLEVVIPAPNNNEEVFPVAWFVSNRKDKAVVEIFFQHIKNNLSDLTLTPSYLFLPPPGLSAGCDWFEIWSSIFGSGPRKLFCNWHIVDDWKQRIQRQSNTSKAAPLEYTRLLSNLQAVLSVPSVNGFLDLMQEFLKDLESNASTIPYANFFKANYAGQPEVWSRAYRSEAHVATEARFEDYHKKISRHIYHEGFKRKQLDVLIKTLMRHSRDKALNKLRQTYKLSSDVCIKEMTEKCHWDSAAMSLDFVSPHEDQHTWSVMSVIDRVRAIEQPTEKGQPIRIKKVAVEYIVKCAEIDQCPARLMCIYRCAECGVCSHHFACSCQSEQKSSLVGSEGLQVLCEHCHLVVRYLHKMGRSVDSIFASHVASSSSAEASTQPPKEASAENNLAVTSDVNKLVVMVVADDDVSVTSDPSDASIASVVPDHDYCEVEMHVIEHEEHRVDAPPYDEVDLVAEVASIDADANKHACPDPGSEDDNGSVVTSSFIKGDTTVETCKTGKDAKELSLSHVCNTPSKNSSANILKRKRKSPRFSKRKRN